MDRFRSGNREGVVVDSESVEMIGDSGTVWKISMVLCGKFLKTFFFALLQIVDL